MRIPLALVAGGALALSQPPVSFPWIVFLSLPVCLWLVASTRRMAGAAGYGWLAGAGYFTATLFWIVEPFQVDP
ncbi:MAG TPA: apolipoprotein N-acyltransferase, partial [Paracoccaceae bacterium]|nr:apolipoprotein N-acyltransferase [Paracoccaceae bacterium]